jgi:hypothetical protein
MLNMMILDVPQMKLQLVSVTKEEAKPNGRHSYLDAALEVTYTLLARAYLHNKGM